MARCVGSDNGMSVCLAVVILDLIQDLVHRRVLFFGDEMLKQVQHDDTKRVQHDARRRVVAADVGGGAVRCVRNEVSVRTMECRSVWRPSSWT